MSAAPEAAWKPAVVVPARSIWTKVVDGSVRALLAQGLANDPRMVRAALLKSDFLMRTLGRPNRDQIVSMRPNELTTLEAIDLANGEVLADALGLHESTVSRVTTQKYLSSTRGSFELKYFFGSHVATDAGGAASSTAIRAMIKTLIAEEDQNEPLTDSRIAELLGEQGIIVARRTVAKYRELQNIAPVNLRRRG